MIAKEGRLFLIPLVLVTFPIGVFAHAYSNQLLIVTYYLLGSLTLFLLYFFRDPIRELPRNPNAFVSPADGKIISIKTIDDEHAGKSSIEISIYLNLFNVHVVRSPFDGNVEEVNRVEGQFIPAFEHNASDVNEKTIVKMKNPDCRYKIRKVAGLIARRIICYAEKNIEFKRGSRMGFIRFGSRVDMIVPSNIKIIAKEGDRVLGGKTIIAELST